VLTTQPNRNDGPMPPCNSEFYISIAFEELKVALPTC
jgi:hypothetical protein